MSYIIPIAAFCGFVAQEAMAISPAIKDDENTPDKFSWRYYFSRPKNQLLLVSNIAGFVALLLSHAELVGIMSKIPFVGPYFDGAAMPVLTGVLIGFGASWVLRLLFRKMSN